MRGPAIVLGTCGAVRECVGRPPPNRGFARACVRDRFSGRAERHAPCGSAANSFGGVVPRAPLAARVCVRTPQMRPSVVPGDALQTGGSTLHVSVNALPLRLAHKQCDGPIWPRGPTRSRTARNLPRAITNARMGEALFGGPTHDARTNAASRAEHLAWPPAWDGAS
jgi:hypothetical protein